MVVSMNSCKNIARRDPAAASWPLALRSMEKWEAMIRDEEFKQAIEWQRCGALVTWLHIAACLC